jgi:hypothetical protein
MRTLGLEPDPWQVEVIHSDHPQLLLNCCRQSGKTTVVAVLALIEAMACARCAAIFGEPIAERARSGASRGDGGGARGVTLREIMVVRQSIQVPHSSFW